MNVTFKFNGPITQMRAEKATEWIIDNVNALAIAKAHRERCENRLRVVKSLAMKASGQKSVAAQEREAYASTEYQDSIDELFQATVEFEKLNATNYAAREVIKVWQSINTNLRAARV
jgi:hypothetical protein